jgi:hypothetical protein
MFPEDPKFYDRLAAIVIVLGVLFCGLIALCLRWHYDHAPQTRTPERSHPRG